MELKERIECLMAEAGMSVQEVARVAGVSPSAVYQWLGKTSNPVRAIGRVEAAIALQEATDFSALWLAKGEGEKYKAPPNHDSDSFLRQSWAEAARRSEDEIVKALLQGGLSVDAIQPTSNHTIDIGLEGARVYRPDLALKRRDGSVLLVEIKIRPFHIRDQDEKRKFRSPVSDFMAVRNRLLEIMLGDNFIVVQANKDAVRVILDRLNQEPQKSLSRLQGSWPFTDIAPARWDALPERAKGRIEAKLELLIEQAESEQAANSRAA